MLANGTVVDERFELRELAGAGGMASIHRALDRSTGELVAFKTLHPSSTDEAVRFVREARVLAELDHPAIVRYVAHGIGPDGAPYLAMRWLDGEDLSRRLHRGPLGTEPTLALARRVLPGLAYAHARGITHRDVKPGNLFLTGGRVESTMLVDFGIARVRHATLHRTRTGVLLGTPGFIAPEQARGETDVGPRADVFAFGCVLYECLTGRPAFAGDSVLAVLARILLDPAPRAREIAADVPPALDALIERMLSKNAAERPADAAAVLDELAALDAHPIEVRAAAAPTMTSDEQRVLCVVLAREPSADESDATRAVESVHANEDTLRQVSVAHGAHFERLVDGAYLTVLEGRGVATDAVARAARCALALRAAVRSASFVLATGRGRVAASRSAGEVIDRAIGMLGPRTPTQGGPVVLDALSARLLGTRFEMADRADGFALVGERDAALGPSLLLGRPMPCVGRERELALLDATFAECIDEASVRTVVVTAPPGTGKSRLAHELVRRLRERDATIELWMAHADPTSDGAPFGMLAQIVQRAARLDAAEAASERRARIVSYVAARVAPSETARISAFLGEIAGAPFPDEHCAEIASARRDASVMADQIRRTWEDLVRASAARSPLLVILEDVQWADPSSVRAMDSALRHAADRPWMILALARPEVTDVFPGLWAARTTSGLALPELSPRASDRLVRSALGERADAAQVAAIVERSGGNALFLEELIRAVADGRTDGASDSALLMVQARLERLEPETRRALRAASVFGQVFWAGGVRALLGARVEAHLDDAVEQELVERRGGTRFAGEIEYRFRHAIVRDAAYAMLTDDDRRTGHALAARYLETTGETDAHQVAEHFDAGGDRTSAARWFARSAEQALEGSDYDGVFVRVERAVERGIDGAALGALRGLECEARTWSNQFDRAAEAGAEALRLLPRGSDAWAHALGEQSMALGRCGRHVDVVRLIDAFDGITTLETPSQVIAAARVGGELAISSEIVRGRALLARAEEAERSLPSPDPLVRGWVARSLAHFAMAAGDIGEVEDCFATAADHLERAGASRNGLLRRMLAGLCALRVGSHERAFVAFTKAIPDAERHLMHVPAGYARDGLRLAHVLAGNVRAARAVPTSPALAPRSSGEVLTVWALRARILALGAVEPRPLEAAEAIVIAVPDYPGLCAGALAAAALALIDAGEIESAREPLERAQALGTRDEELGATIDLARASWCRARGEHDMARELATSGRDDLLSRAAAITSEDKRRGFLERVPQHARLLALAAP